MKLCLVLLSLTCSFYFPSQKNYAVQDYIVVQYTGVEQKPAKQLLIVLEEPTLSTTYSALKAVDVDLTSMREEEAVYLKNLLFNTVITDRRVFSSLKQYVRNYYKNFSSTKSSKFNVLIDSHRYVILPQQEKSFFKNLNSLFKNRLRAYRDFNWPEL